MSAVEVRPEALSPTVRVNPLRASLAALLHSLKLLEDDALFADPVAVRECLGVVRARAKRLEEVHSDLARPSHENAHGPESRESQPPDRPDPQALRAIQDIRTLRAERVHERKARVVAEAELHREIIETVRLLLSFLERRWPERVAQCRKAARLAGRLADAAGMTPEDARAIQIAALLQDVGLIALPDALLRAPTAGFSPAERSVYQQHPSIARDALGGGSFAQIGSWILHHHERWDGAGYPDGLTGDDIPLPARVVGLATAYVEAAGREGGTAVNWRREQVASGAFDPSLLKYLERTARNADV